MAGGVVVIAEAGVNHNGDLELARRLVDAAADAGADAVKFQTFRAEALVSPQAPKAEYQRRTTDAAESQLDMIRALELSSAHHRVLLDHAASRGIAFLSTPFDLDSLAFLTDDLGLRRIKLGSGELTNGPLLLAAARRAEQLIVSTGMGSLAEVEDALRMLAFGFVAAPATDPSPAAMEEAYGTPAARAALQERVVLLHCTTDYPTSFPDVNLRAMATLRRAFGLRIGYSDHTPGLHVAVAAVAAGACVVEKHVTLDRALPGPDHAASLEPDELATLVAQIRDIEQAMGDGLKAATEAERANRVVARKSLVTTQPVAAGEPFTSHNLACKRPGNGVSPMAYWSYLGRPARRDYDRDELVE